VPRADGGVDLRVAVGFGTKPYGTMRVSVVNPSSAPVPQLTVDGQATTWQYSAPFK
jgi:hypothetical protein